MLKLFIKSNTSLMKYILLLLAFLFLNTSIQAKDGFKLKIIIQNNDDSVIYLCHYYGKSSTVYKDDSAKFPKDGTVSMSMQSTKKIVGGIYILLFSDRKTQLDFLLNNGDDFIINFDKNNPSTSVKVIGNTDNNKFFEYQKFLNSTIAKFDALNEGFKGQKSKKDSLEFKEKNTKLNDELMAYRKKFIEQNPNNLASTVYNALQEPTIPEGKHYLKDGKSIDSNFGYHYYKSHYWDNFNFQDDRLIFTPIYERKLEGYFKILAPSADSNIAACEMILGKTRGAPDMFKYSLWWLTRRFETSKIMGQDEVFVRLVENYYMKGEAIWLQDTVLKKYIKRASDIAPNMIGQQAADLRLLSIGGVVEPLTKVYPNHKYTVLVFWSATCGHCKKEIPKIDSVVQLLNKKTDVSIYAVLTDSEPEKWKTFINENKLDKNWLHVHDPSHTSNFKSLYDVYSTPVVYLIDTNGKIVGKRIDSSNIADLIGFLESKNKQ
jgi:thiol-disulfide isomerase/thioredoxin